MLSQHPQVVQTQFHYLEFSVNLIEQICICQLFATNQNSQFENNWGRKTWGFLEKSCFTFCDFHWVFFLLYNGTYDSEKKGKSGCWCKPQMRDWLYCLRIGYGHGSAPWNCIRDIQLQNKCLFLPQNYNCVAYFSRGLEFPTSVNLFLQAHLHWRRRSTIRRKPVLFFFSFSQETS